MSTTHGQMGASGLPLTPSCQGTNAVDERPTRRFSKVLDSARSVRSPFGAKNAPMRLFDPHIHMTSRTTDDYEAMARRRHHGLVEPAFWLGQPRTHVGSSRTTSLAHRLGALPRQPVRHPSLLHAGAEPQGGQRSRARRRGHRALAALPGEGRRGRGRRDRLRRHDARPKKSTSPRRSSSRKSSICRCSSTRRTATRSAAPSARSRSIRELKFPEERVLIDHNNEETLPLVLDTGCWAGHSIYPNTKMDEARMVALVKKYGTSASSSTARPTGA